TFVRDKLTGTNLAPDEIDRHFDIFVDSGATTSRMALSFSPDIRVFKRMRDLLDGGSRGPELCKSMLDLLVAFETRQRDRVVKVLVDYWDPFVECDFAKVLSVLRRGRMPDIFRDDVRQLLECLLAGPHQREARDSLDWLLGQ